MKSALDIAHDAELQPITDVASKAGIQPNELEPFGKHRGKVQLPILERLAKGKDGKLVIVTAITPTKAGEGKTTTSVALTQGLGQIGKKVMLCLREPSMGPVFGVKGGGTGGGYAQIGPMEEINLHFNGDFHAVTAAHSLLAAAHRRVDLQRQPAAHRPGDHHVAAHGRHERPRAALHASSASAARRTASRARTSSSSPPRRR